VSKRISVNGIPAQVNQALLEGDEVMLDDKVLKPAKSFIYLAYNKPRGVESTLNSGIEKNLKKMIGVQDGVVPAGRLDKESEGLMILTNDGYLVKAITQSKNLQEKEYIVEVDAIISREFIDRMSSGVLIMGKMTRRADVELLGEKTFRIVLTQGMNRQIRRMCFKLGYEVTSLKRIRIVNIQLGDLEVNCTRDLTEQEVNVLKKKCLG
jgi:23S rRNA pseudouridine2604 synthase